MTFWMRFSDAREPDLASLTFPGRRAYPAVMELGELPPSRHSEAVSGAAVEQRATQVEPVVRGTRQPGLFGDRRRWKQAQVFTKPARKLPALVDTVDLGAVTSKRNQRRNDERPGAGGRCARAPDDSLGVNGILPLQFGRP